MDKIILEALPGSAELERLDLWRMDLLSAEAAWSEFAIEIGAERMFHMSGQKPGSFSFPDNQPPEGWTKPSRRGASRPKKSIEGRAWRDRIAALPQPERLAFVAQELGLPSAFSWSSGDIHGTSALGGLNSWSIAWANDRIFLIGEDWLAKMDEMRKDRPGITFNLNAGKEEISAGFIRRSEAELDLAIAQARVAREKKVEGFLS